MPRKLAAILAADVVGYSRMIAANETATLDALDTLRAEVFGPVFTDHHGTIVKSMGDGWLVAFESAVAAVNAAMQVQDRLTDHPTITLRIGIHIGDVVHNEHDLYGDGINIAARLESIAPKGGITISDAVYSSLDGTLSPSFEAAGAQKLKNIDRPIITWVRTPSGGAIQQRTPAQDVVSALPRLRIEPTANSDPRAELRDTADALSADFDTYFSSINWLQANIKSTPIPDAYALRPVLRARGERIRLETRLYSPAGDTLWTHKSDTTLDEAFDWQDSVIAEIADHCIGLILEAETTRIMALPDEDLTAEQCLLMGIITWRDFGRDSYIRSVQFHERAMIAKPDMADAYAEALIVLQAGRTVTSSDILQEYFDKIPAWIEAARPWHPDMPC
ncbi:adenylate/guanylate cyclase domain-containing protein [Sulfitobacter aestuariivivens]|uniref:adenylate/guanylate cyclase domain-containing protein n=1 Tax=Sulfitobacter aestuariivivens TaxID=2766981 RepID=UPI0036112E0F